MCLVWIPGFCAGLRENRLRTCRRIRPSCLASPAGASARPILGASEAAPQAARHVGPPAAAPNDVGRRGSLYIPSSALNKQPPDGTAWQGMRPLFLARDCHKPALLQKQLHPGHECTLMLICKAARMCQAARQMLCQLLAQAGFARRQPGKGLAGMTPMHTRPN